MKDSGLCECGCGRRTPLAAQTRRVLGHVKNQPLRFINGHSGGNKAKGLLYHIDMSTGCWIWDRAKDERGYGRVWNPKGGSSLAHRVMYEKVHGPIPEGKDIDHLCRNTSCINPEHLEVVDHRTNVLRGEGTPAKHAQQSHCKRGHLFTPENTYVNRNGGRECRACRQLRRARNGAGHE